MNAGLQHTPRSKRSVAIEYGQLARSRRERVPPAICMMGIIDPREARFTDVFPRAVLLTSRDLDPDHFVEHIRIQTLEATAYLPGLDSRRPSLLRDSVRLALTAGAPYVDVILARFPDLMPWDLDDPRTVGTFDVFAQHMVGANVVFPDLLGPVPSSPLASVDHEAIAKRAARTIKLHGPRWTERFQVAFVDSPYFETRRQQVDFLKSISGFDCSVARWNCNPIQAPVHSWRSAASVIGGGVAAMHADIYRGVEGLRFNLAEGRRSTVGRREDLRVGEWERKTLGDDEYFIDLTPTEDGKAAVPGADCTMRAPVGSWSIPALRTTKVIHWRVWQTASQFVFENVNEQRAFALGTAVMGTLQPYSQAGLLVGPNGEETPEVRAGAVRDISAPGLRVEITGTLQPWTQSVKMRVNLQPGREPAVEEI